MSNALAKKPAAGVDNTARRVWDKEEFRKKAEENAKVRAVPSLRWLALSWALSLTGPFASFTACLFSLSAG